MQYFNCRILSLLIMIIAPVIVASDWPQFLGPQANGMSKETGILKDWNTKAPKEVWTLRVGEGYSAPSVAGDRLFMFDREGDQARLRCLDRRTGKEIWTTSYPTSYEDMYQFSNGPRAAPLIEGDRVYIHGVDGMLRCQKTSDGSIIWEMDTNKKYGVVQNFFGVGSSPVIYGDKLIVMVGGSPADSPKIRTGNTKGNGSGIVAFDKKTGKELYKFSDEMASYATPIIAKINGRDYGLAFARGGLLGFDPKSGAKDFHFPWRARKIESVNAATPVVIGDQIFITESYEYGGALLKVKNKEVEVVWKDPPRRGQSMASHWATPIHRNGYLYGCHGESAGNAELRSLELATGKVLWSKPGLKRTSLLYADGHLLVLGEGGDLTLVEANPKQYVEKGQLKKLVNSPAWNAPVLSKGLLYVRGGASLASS